MKKAAHSTDRNLVHDHQQIINVGPSMADEFRRINYNRPSDLIGKDPFVVYELICRTSGGFQDPCVLDCVWSAIDYMNGLPPKKWWDYTSKRKSKYADRIEALRTELG